MIETRRSEADACGGLSGDREENFGCESIVENPNEFQKAR